MRLPVFRALQAGKQLSLTKTYLNTFYNFAKEGQYEENRISAAG